MKPKILRSKRETPFVQIDKRPLHNTKLSWKAKGILAYLLSLPDDWELFIHELVKHSKDGRSSTETGVNELILMGYIERISKRNTKGQFEGYDYLVHESPKCGNTGNGKPVYGKPEYGKPEYGNPATTNNNNTNNNFTDKKITNKEAISGKAAVHLFSESFDDIHKQKKGIEFLWDSGRAKWFKALKNSEKVLKKVALKKKALNRMQKH